MKVSESWWHLVSSAVLAVLWVFAALQAYCQSWLPVNSPPAKWRSLAISADAQNLTGIASDTLGVSNAIYFSTNSGATWHTNAFPTGFNGIWRSIACSADGTKLIAGVTGGTGLSPVYSSTNSGTSWTSNNTLKTSWISVAASGDARVLIAASFNSRLTITSTNSGATWSTAPLPIVQWDAVSCSTDGQTLAVGGNVGPIYVSTNSGSSWVLANAPDQAWAALASSSDGTLLAAAAFLPAGNIHVSTNRGVDWQPSSAPIANWTSLSCSANGKCILASANGSGAGGPIYSSTNYGLNWISNSAPIIDWRSVAVSADGGKMFAAAMNQLVYVCQTVVAPELLISGNAGEAVVSWMVPSSNFRLYENPNPAVSEWQVVTNIPVLDPTNLRLQVTRPTLSERSFFRLQLP